MKRIIFIYVLSLLWVSTYSQTENTNYGTNAGNSGNYNSAFGHTAADQVTGDHNTTIGRRTGQNLTSGGQNTFVGSSIIGNISGISGNNNSFLGYQVGNFLSSGSNNTFGLSVRLL